MRKHFVSILAVAALGLTLGACQPPASGDAADPGQGAADAGAPPTAAAPSEVEAAFLGQTAPPAGFTEEGGHIEDAGGEIHVVYGTWTQTGAAQRVMYVQRGSGASAAQIVSVFAIPPPRANEMIFSENCTHPDFPEPASRIYASAGTAQQRPGLSDPPSSAWRLDRETGRLLPLDASRVTCAFDHME